MLEVAALAILRLDQVGALVHCSSAWAERTEPEEARLVLGAPSTEVALLGAFQRSSDAPLDAPARPIVRRGSGGGVALAGPGTVWMQLAMTRSNALVADCTADKLLNRMVRPLLRALTRVSSVPANYFGRDWVSAGHRPIAIVAFAHEAASGACLVEAVVGVNAPFVPSARASFRDKAPSTLAAVAGKASLDAQRVMEAIGTAYRDLAAETRELAPFDVPLETVPSEPAWRAFREEAIGTVAAGADASGRLRVGGELMASRDAIARLEELVAALPAGASPDEVGHVVDEALAAHGAITFGVRSLASLRDVIVVAAGQ
jgi:hypothetical protein